LVEIEFYGDAPALRNDIKVWLMSSFLEGSSVADAPDWFRISAENKTLARDLRKEFEHVTRGELFAVCRAGNGMVTVLRLHFIEANTGHPLLSDEAVKFQLLSHEAVESIGREDYVRVIACLGRPITNRYFEERIVLE
jgi:hypothetical protein